MVGVAIYFEDWIFGIIAFIVIGTIKPGFVIGSIAEELSNEKELVSYGRLLNLPCEYLEMIITKVIKAFPNLMGKKAYATYTTQLWEKLINVPPSLGQAIVLLLIYIIVLFIVIWPFILIGIF
jgi:hypothetical protein